jgi:hypothetical protein
MPKEDITIKRSDVNYTLKHQYLEEGYQQYAFYPHNFDRRQPF